MLKPWTRWCLILTASTLLAACAAHPDRYQGPAAPTPEQLPPPTALME